MAKAHPSNAPGPFYVEDGCCITCGVPHEIAPDLFAWTEDESHCFVRRQPTAASDVDRMIEAMWSSEADCIRYRGTDAALLTRIAQFGAADRCDVDSGPILAQIRNLVVFRSALGEEDSAVGLADRFRAALEARQGPVPMRIRPRRRWRPARVIFSWSLPFPGYARFHSVTFAGRREGGGRFEARLVAGWKPAANGLALRVHDWLASDEAAGDIRWFSRAELEAGGGGFHMPI